MLNSIEGVGKDKFIILGVKDKTKELEGITKEQLRDDNEFQNLLKRIKPRPFVQTGMVSFNNKDFGYVYISKINQEYVYEIAMLFKDGATDQNPYKDVLFEGQAFTRYGSVNAVLDDAGRRKLYSLKVQAENTSSIRPLHLKTRNKEENVFAFLGSWNEKYSGDITIIEQITGMDYITSQEYFKDELINNSDSFSYIRNVWKCYSHRNLLLSISSKLFDEDIDMFFSVANSILDSIDNYAKDAQDGVFSEPINYYSNFNYSAEILKGVFETIALLGNNESSFSNCTKNHISNQIWEIERRVFSCSNDRAYYILSDYFQYLGEAQPKSFLYEIDKLINEKSEPFIEFLRNENENKYVYKGYYHLDRIFRCLAVDERYFASAINIIVQLAKFDSRFIDTAVYILLPWYPQTQASINKRIAIVRSLATTNEEIIWGILMKLMPGKTTSSISLTLSGKGDVDTYCTQKNIKIRRHEKMLDVNKYNKLINDAYRCSGGTSHEQHKTKVFLVEISKAWLKNSGYKYDHSAKTGYWRIPGTIDQMANENLVRLYLATPTSHHRYQESEVWCKE